ncbi:hypothetical protein PH210_25590 [Paenibacillus sp. BSR1-1]|uniref:hypothetical protein n=1 Tax=Paenibacillus sp. BSR1-1 TaxID=3020845 RepID=UPI0025B008FD|nr:hypothetical protein [Paenibacillus sp. BSR1-1]MDN3019541.1 hypothetical protein [Paenibacillus sp. BSR1-1]
MWYWWLFLSSAIFNIVAIKAKPVLKPIEYYATIVTCLFIAETFDRWTDKMENIYGFFKEHIMEWQTFVIILGIYPASAYLILTWFPYGKPWLKKLQYIMVWSVFSTGFEKSFHLIGYEYFSGEWKITYSALFYPLIYSMMFLILKFVRYLINKEKAPS